MKKIYTTGLFITGIFLLNIFTANRVYAQCNNADFEAGNFSGGWSGTYSAGQCSGIYLFGICTGCSPTNPTNSTGMNQGPNNDPPSDATTEYSHVITTSAGGNDPNIATYGGSLPMAYPGSGSYSARMGNMWQAVGSDATGDGETMTYTFTVTPNNCNFTYHYAVVLNDGGHSNGEQPFFNIKMTDGNGGDISCADYQVDATTASSIGGFNYISSAAIYWKPWTSVFIPLNNYIGQTVSITFTTRGCLPSGCAGSHYSYAYIDAECAPLTLVASSPTVCGGQNLTLTAPAGAATYSWTGPGIVSGATQQTVTIDQPGQYIVNMTTFGNTPCNFSLDTVMVGNPANPFANFSAATVCVGSPMTFTDLSTPHPSLTAWSWDFGDGGTSGTENPTHTYSAAGTYPVTLTVTSPPCTKDTIIDVTVSPPPTSTFTATGPVCVSQASIVTYTGNGLAGDTYTWNFDGGVASPGAGQGPQSVTWSTPGTKNLTLTVSAGSCVSTPTTVQVVVNPGPVVTITPHTSICADGSAQLTVSGATSYTWANDPSLSSTTTATVTAQPTVSTVYTVTASSASCTIIDTTSVSVYPVPTSPFTAPGPVCAGQNVTVTYTGNADAAATYTWNFGGGINTPASGQGPFQVYWNTGGTQTVTLTVSEYGCTSSPNSVQVVVNPSPTATFTAPAQLCVNQQGTFTFTGNASGAATYNWSWGGGNVASGTGVGPYSVSWPSSGTETVALTVTDNGCTATSTVNVPVYNIPTSTFTAQSPVCFPGPSAVTYTGTGTANATYTWNFGSGVATPGSGQGPQSVAWTATGTQTITLQVTENGCAGPTVTQNVIVNPVPTSDFTVVSPVCTGVASTVTYTGVNADNLATYTWGFDGGAANPGTGQGPQAVSWATAGTKNVTLQVSENGCTSGVTTQQVVVNAIPTSTFTATSPLCANQNGTVTYTGTGSSNATYTWSFAGGAANPGFGQGPQTIRWGTPGTYYIVLNVTENGCVGPIDSVPVVVNAIPTSDAGNDTVVCNGNNVSIGTTPTAGYSYNWVPTTALSSASVSNPTVSLANNTSNTVVSQTYTVTTSALGCSSTASVTVVINPIPNPAFVTPAPECLTGNTFTFKSVGNNLNSAVLSWSFGNDATPATSSATTQTVTYATAGTRAVSLTVSQLGCADSLTDSATVYPMPVLAFAPDTIKGCENFYVCFNNASTGVGPMTYAWNFGDGGISSDSSPCHTFVAPGFYTVSLKITSSEQCSYDTTVQNLIQVIANPIAAFTPNVVVIQLPQNEIDFTNQSLNSTSYLWSFSNQGVNNNVIGLTSDVNPAYHFPEYGLYLVVLRSYNELMCVDSTQQTVSVLPPQNFFIPNAFTPNGDGNNDEFFIYLEEGSTLESFKIFNRWGEKVHDGLYPWDGNYKGAKAPEGVYVYEARIKQIDQHVAIERKGSVTLIR